jgi:hypothetical protein
MIVVFVGLSGWSCQEVEAARPKGCAELSVAERSQRFVRKRLAQFETLTRPASVRYQPYDRFILSG